MSHDHNPSRDRKGAVPTTATKTFPPAYLLTFTCYGTRLHGDEKGTVDRKHNFPGSDWLPPDSRRVSAEQRQMKQAPYELDARRRAIVLQAIRDAFTYKPWKVLAAHVRQTHVHAVVAAEEVPEKVLNNFKSFASRALNRAGIDGNDRTGGRDMEAPVISGASRMCVQRSSTSSMGRENRWRCGRV